MIVRNPDLRVYLLHLASLSLLPYFLPILLRIPFNRLGPELPWTFQTSVFLHAISSRTIIHLNWFEVGLRTVLLKSCDSRWLLEVQVKLNMRRALLALLQLTNNVTSLPMSVPFFKIINYKINWGVIISTNIGASDSLLLHPKLKIIKNNNITPLL